MENPFPLNSTVLFTSCESASVNTELFFIERIKCYLKYFVFVSKSNHVFYYNGFTKRYSLRINIAVTPLSKTYRLIFDTKAS